MKSVMGVKRSKSEQIFRQCSSNSFCETRARSAMTKAVTTITLDARTGNKDVNPASTLLEQAAAVPSPESLAPQESSVAVGDIDGRRSGLVTNQLRPAVLDTISATKPTLVQRTSKGGESRSRSCPSYSGDHTPSVSPRSINMESSVGSGQSPPLAKNNPETPGAPPASAPPRHGHGHRRTASENLEEGYDHYYQYPPAHIFYTHGANLSPKQNDGNGVPPVPQHPGRNRVRSWSGNQPYVPGYPPPGVIPYPPSPGVQGNFPSQQAYSPNGTPLMPTMADPAFNGVGMPMMPQPGHYTGASSRRKRKGGGHRRVHSYSGVPSYGSGMSDFFSPPPPPHGPPPPVPSGRNRSDFSPRTEFMKLASGFRPSQVPTSPGPSPPHSYRQMSPRPSSFRGAGSFPKADEHMRVSFSPAAPLFDSIPNGMIGGYGTDFGNSGRIFDANDNSGAGEAVFFAQKTTKHRHKKSPSSRRMHMRQRSAQLFMEDVKGVEQNPACRDVFFLLLFLFHLLGIVYLGNVYGTESLKPHDDFDNDASLTIIYRNVVYVACLSGVFAVSASALALLVMTVLARKIVQIALILTISLSFAWGTIGIGLSPKKVVPATGIIALMLSVAYAFIVWDRIPFAAANLNAALSGIRANPGSVVITFFFQALSLAYSIYFTYVVLGVYDAIVMGDLELTYQWRVALYSSLGVSYYWTFHVFLNIVQVTVAGVIGSWWFTSEGDNTSRGPNLNRAFFRSSFYAFGSICFGSLFVGPVKLLRQVAGLARPSGEGHSLLCLHECLHCVQTCITTCVDYLADRFSPWAFTYVGLYGYGFLDAGRHATELFDKRGWTTIVTDDLVPNVLLLASLVIGGITGCFAHFIESTESLSFTSLNEPMTTSFLVGLVVGLVVTSVLFGIISSSVNAVIVCFAASPVDFEQNHPELSQDMRAAWREVWPGCMDVVDLRVAVAAYSSGNVGDERQPLL